MSTWQTMITAPQDGTEIEVHLPSRRARAFWCSDQNRWVLSRPLQADYADDALMRCPIVGRDGETVAAPADGGNDGGVR